ncbi:adhesive plaque matrix protein [Frankliniella occidentalis]|uniref:Adhesive plaque matrix protein n=1 Tax=Frankliniella occidentalis TaxID=133901 RepID=A0A9C6XWI2_FRAOC|nr:adhesive plaque matrix protein [Frankliniella occidentalis]
MYCERACERARERERGRECGSGVIGVSSRALIAVVVLLFLGGAAALPTPRTSAWRSQRSPKPQYAHPPESQPQFAHPPESQPQYAHPPESQPQFAHPPESQPQFAHPPESQPQYAHPLESQPQFAHPPESQHQFEVERPRFQPSQSYRRPLYRRGGPGQFNRPLKPRQFADEQQGVRHAFFKSFYPEPTTAGEVATSTTSTTAAPTTSTTTTTTMTPPPTDVHVVAMSVSTSVKKGSEDVHEGATVEEPPGSASVIHPVLLPPVSGPARFRADWEVRDEQTSPRPPAPQPRHALPQVYGMPEENYEVDEALSVLSNGRAHGRQPTATAPTADKVTESSPPPSPSSSTTAAQQDKEDGGKPSGYVVEGRNYRKYRVEEKTPDGFIVGEYGVVSHQDGSLRGVRYTADSTINPRLIYDALVKFLSL